MTHLGVDIFEYLKETGHQALLHEFIRLQTAEFVNFSEWRHFLRKVRLELERELMDFERFGTIETQVYELRKALQSKEDKSYNKPKSIEKIEDHVTECRI